MLSISLYGIFLTHMRKVCNMRDARYAYVMYVVERIIHDKMLFQYLKSSKVISRK